MSGQDGGGDSRNFPYRPPGLHCYCKRRLLAWAVNEPSSHTSRISTAPGARSANKTCFFDRRPVVAAQRNFSCDRQCRCVPAEGASPCCLQIWKNPPNRQIVCLAVGPNTILCGQSA